MFNQRIAVPAPGQSRPAGPVTTEKQVDTTASVPPISPKDPNALLDSDILLDTLDNKKGHIIRIIRRTDPAQFIPFFAICKCGYQARVYEEQDVRTAAQNHLDYVKTHPTRL